jgi:putative lipoprotein
VATLMPGAPLQQPGKKPSSVRETAMRSGSVLWLALPAFLAAACYRAPAPAPAPVPVIAPAVEPAPPPLPPEAFITGTVSYSRRVPLNPEAMLEVLLVDASVGGDAALVVAAETMPARGEGPIAFDLGYDPRRLDPQRRYALHARITERGVVRLASDASNPVVFRGIPGGGPVALRLLPLEGSYDAEPPLGAR